MLTVLVCLLGACLNPDGTGHGAPGTVPEAPAVRDGFLAFTRLSVLVADLLAPAWWPCSGEDCTRPTLVLYSPGSVVMARANHEALPVLGELVSPPPSACAGSMTISDGASYAVAALCTTIGGSLTVDPAFLGSVVFLPLLGSVDGDIFVEYHPQLTTLSLPLLGYLGGDFFADLNIHLSLVHMPLLGSVGGSLFAGSNPRLVFLDFAVLVAVGGSIIVEYSSDLTELGMPLLSSVGVDLIVDGNDGLVALDLPRLCSVVGNLYVRHNQILPSLEIPLLGSVGAHMIVAFNLNLVCIDSPALTSVGFPIDTPLETQLRACPTLACLQEGVLSCPGLHDQHLRLLPEGGRYDRRGEQNRPSFD